MKDTTLCHDTTHNLIESQCIIYNLFHFPLFSDERFILINNIRNINSSILNLNDFRFPEVPLFGNSSFKNTKNTSVLNITMEYIVSSKRFDVPLLDSWSVQQNLHIHAWMFYLPNLLLLLLLLSLLVLLLLLMFHILLLQSAFTIYL